MDGSERVFEGDLISESFSLSKNVANHYSEPFFSLDEKVRDSDFETFI